MTQSTTFQCFNFFSMHCLGLFERYDSIEDIKRGIKSNKITITIATVLSIYAIAHAVFRFLYFTYWFNVIFVCTAIVIKGKVVVDVFQVAIVFGWFMFRCLLGFIRFVQFPLTLFILVELFVVLVDGDRFTYFPKKNKFLNVKTKKSIIIKTVK